MLNAENKQFQLEKDGRIHFQPDPTNPLTGAAVAKLIKGEAMTRPAIALLDDAVLPDGVDKAAALQKVGEWFAAYCHETLLGLVMLDDEEDIPEAARSICKKLHEALGIMPREALEDECAKLDETARQALRNRKVRMGPLLVYVFTLNKPAAIRLRATMWYLWHGLPLPASVPSDGATSIAIEDQNADPQYYRAIGYPLYGGRAIRVDMLDRLVCEVYERADKGLFKADHKMAEWLGCSIPGLYKILEDMGHKKVFDPAETEEAAEDKKENATVEEKTPEEKAPDAGAEAKQEPQKPELATFKLRRGKAYGGAGASKPEHKKKFSGKPAAAKQKKHKKQGAKPHDKAHRDKERVISAPSRKDSASPFDVLKQLKGGS